MTLAEKGDESEVREAEEDVMVGGEDRRKGPGCDSQWVALCEVAYASGEVFHLDTNSLGFDCWVDE